MRLQKVFAAVALAACVGGAASPAGAQAPSLSEILAKSPASDWRPLDPDNTLYMELPGGRVVIELAPDFSPQHVANVRALAHADYWASAAIVRVQDDYVVQWSRVQGDKHDMGTAVATIPVPEYDRPVGDLPFTRLPDPDSYAPETGFTDGFPAGRDGHGRTWMLHCYGAVGVGRADPPDNGNGTELYAVIGQAPRHLDRNVALIGRVVQGMELLSSLPRGTGAMGFYATQAERVPIRSIRLAADVPPRRRTDLEVLRTDSRTFQEVIRSRRFRRESWFVEPTGHINVCNVPLPVRPVPRAR